MWLAGDLNELVCYRKEAVLQGQVAQEQVARQDLILSHKQTRA